MDIIAQREQLVKEIRWFVLQNTTDNKKIDELERMLVRLRFLSIRCVELIVLWRDQFRHFALI